MIMVIGFLMSMRQGWQPVTTLELTYLGGAAIAIMAAYQFAIMTMRIGEVSFVAPFRYTALIWAIPLSMFVFGDMPDIWMLTGSAIVVATGIYTFFRERKISR